MRPPFFDDLGKRDSGIVRFPLEPEDDCALTVLALIIRATPGTMWVEYNRIRSGLLIHLLDLVDEEEWIHQIKAKYEALLMRISAHDGPCSRLGIAAAQVILGIAMCLAAWRVAFGPRAQVRVLGLDALYVNAMLMLLSFGIQTGRTLYFKSALTIALLEFVGTVAAAKFLLRDEVIE